MDNDDTNNTSSSFGFYVIVFVIIVIIIAVVLYFYFRSPPSPPSPPPPSTVPFGTISVPANLPNTLTDCGHFGNSVPSGTFCPAGKADFQGICYDDTWSANGGTKTSICTVDYGPFQQLYTECGIGIYDLDYGAPCTMIGPKFFKTAVCTCQQGGVVTAADYCRNPSRPVSCPPGTDAFGGACYGASCPTGYHRTDRCTCQKNGT